MCVKVALYNKPTFYYNGKVKSYIYIIILLAIDLFSKITRYDINLKNVRVGVKHQLLTQRVTYHCEIGYFNILLDIEICDCTIDCFCFTLSHR